MKLTEADSDRAIDAHFPPVRHRAVVIPWPCDIRPQIDAQDTVPTDYRGCNGNCTQGRACDCVPDVETREPMTDTDRRWMLALYTASAALVGLAAWISLT